MNATKNPGPKHITVTAWFATCADDYDLWPGDTVKSLATGNVFRMTSEGKLDKVSGSGMVLDRLNSAANHGVL